MDESDMRPPGLGDRVREVVTGRYGTVTGYCEYLWGCQQFLVYLQDELDKDGNPKNDWFDVGRLEVVERAVVHAVLYNDTLVTGVPGTREAVFSGADTPAPRR